MTAPAASDIALSVCIPTHDGRADELATAIDSVLAQLSAGLRGRVELCVSDNASRDGTEQLVRDRQASLPGTIVYRRHGRDLGASRNLIAAADMARGRWIWLLGSDDALDQGSISAVLDLLSRHPSVSGASVSRRLYRRDLDEPLGLTEPRLLPPHTRVTVFAGRNAIEALGLYGTYISGQVVAATEWGAARARVGAARLEASLFPHTWLLASIWLHGGAWLWDPTARVRCRMANESFGGGDYAAYVGRTLGDLRNMWVALLGSRAARAPLLGLLDLFLPANNRDNILWGAVNGGASAPHARRRLLVTFLRTFWWSVRFWRDTMPALAFAAFGEAVSGRTSDAKARRVRAARTSTTVEHVPPVPAAGATWLVRCRVTNRGPAELRSSPRYPLNLAGRWFDESTGALVQDSERAPLCPSLAPGECRQVSLRLRIPPHAGDYVLRVAPMIEGLAWLDGVSPDNGIAMLVRIRDDESSA